MASVLVTGGNRGIGLELVKQLKARGDQVIAVVRKRSEALSETGAQIIEDVDVTQPETLTKLAATLGDTKLDWVINNAGILNSDGLNNLDFDSIKSQLEVNSIGPLRLVDAVLANINPEGKIGIVTSRMGSLSDNTSGGYYGYRMSKAAVNAAGVSLARDLAGKRISVVLLHPGFVKTDMTGGAGDVEPSKAAQGLIARLNELTLERSGSFMHANGETLSW